MDRTTVYPGQVPRALDNLQLGEFAMVGLAKLAEAMLGTTTVVSQGGFAVTPGGGLNIAVAAGQVYQLESIEATADSALPVNGTQVLKQGVALNAQTLTLAPPSTVGYAQSFLLQVAYADVPDGQIVLSYQNPTPVLDQATGALKYVTYPGPGGNGQAQYTILRGGVSVVAKAGAPALSGSQGIPSPDAGYVGLYVITLAYGATSIAPGNISPYAGAPFLPFTLPQIPPAIQAQSGNGGNDAGTANAMAITLPSYTPGALPDFTPIRFKKGSNPNTGPTSIVINGVTYAVQTSTGSPLVGGELPANGTGSGLIIGGALRLGVSGAAASAPTPYTGGNAQGGQAYILDLSSQQVFTLPNPAGLAAGWFCDVYTLGSPSSYQTAYAQIAAGAGSTALTYRGDTHTPFYLIGNGECFRFFWTGSKFLVLTLSQPLQITCYRTNGNAANAAGTGSVVQLGFTANSGYPGLFSLGSAYITVPVSGTYQIAIGAGFTGTTSAYVGCTVYAADGPALGNIFANQPINVNNLASQYPFAETSQYLKQGTTVYAVAYVANNANYIQQANVFSMILTGR